RSSRVPRLQRLHAMRRDQRRRKHDHRRRPGRRAARLGRRRKIARPVQRAVIMKTRFQLHLSTAIVLMFAAGILTWANVSERAVRHKELHENMTEQLNVPFVQCDSYYGWPVAIFWEDRMKNAAPVTFEGRRFASFVVDIGSSGQPHDSLPVPIALNV